ncbi:hypothetical protein ILYODFUR_034604 [Ilyodon furcidens]|uniref:Uncharacterized protein n=1 Tax=Ilyodon furcidens TaxID=33524 RepID=A0ABV0TQF8_9TELE
MKPVHPPPLLWCPPHNPPNIVIDQGTKYLCKTHLNSSTLFPLARLLLLLAVCQKQTSKRQYTISFPVHCSLPFENCCSRQSFIPQKNVTRTALALFSALFFTKKDNEASTSLK